MTQELDANTRIPRRWSEERWSQGRDVADEIVSQDDVRHDPGEPAPGEGPEGVKQLVQTLRTFTPDLRITSEDMVTEGDSVAMRSVTSGTDTGGRMGRAPTGRVTHIVGMQFFRIRGGKIVESWALRDDLSALRQLGILPTALIRYSAVGGTHAGAARAAGGNGSPRRRPSVIKHTVSSVAFIAACVLRSTVAR